MLVLHLLPGQPLGLPDMQPCAIKLYMDCAEVTVAAAMDTILAKPGCLKRTAGSKIPSVRKASYQLFLTLCKR